MATIREFLASHPRDATLRLDQGRTAIFIAHRLSTISDCDHIFVLKNGQVFEQGNHESLIKQNGLYADMWRAQSLE